MTPVERARRIAAALFLVTAALFAIGVAAEDDKHAEPADQGEATEEAGQEAGGEPEGHQEGAASTSLSSSPSAAAAGLT